MRKNLQMTSDESKFIKRLNNPIKIQEFLDSIQYNTKPVTRSPRFVLKERSANCFEGAMFAAACQYINGYPPLIVDLKAVNDDDHVIAVFKIDEHWGAMAKSNFTTLRFREPVYRTLRELAMSYFDLYFNTKGEKTLREYSNTLDLRKYEKNNWITTDGDLEYIGSALDRARHYRLIDISQEKCLSKVSPMLLESGLMGSDPDGLFIPE